MMSRNRSIMDTESKLALKFVMAGIKRLIVDNRGGLSYMFNFDEILKNIFGVKNFTKRLNECYDDRETIIVVNEIGMKNLMELCNNKRVYAAFSELVLMNVQMHNLNRTFKKMERKGKKRDKELVKEFDYISELYKDAIKTLRKKFGVHRKKTSYKKRFRTVSDMVDSRKGFYTYDDDDGFASMFFDHDDNYDDYDDDESSPFDQFVDRYTKGQSNYKKKGRVSTKSNVERLINNDDYDDEDDFDSLEEDREIDDKLDLLVSNMSLLTSTVQSMVNTRGSAAPSTFVPTNADRDLSENLQNLTKALMYMAEKQNQSVDLQHNILSVLADMDEDSEEAVEDQDDEGIPIIRPKIATDKNGYVPSREELINIVNGSDGFAFKQKPDEALGLESVSQKQEVPDKIPEAVD